MTDECVTLISGCEVEVIVASETCPVEVIEADSSTVEVIEVGDNGGETNTASNSGTGEGLALAKNGVDLPFKSLTHDSTIVLVPSAEELGIGVNAANVEHQNLSGAGLADHAAIDSHLSDGTIHFAEGSIDHAAIQHIGTNSHAQLDTHVANALVHFLMGAIDHTVIQNIGTNSHGVIDAHLASSANPHSVTLEQARSQNNVLAGDVDLGNNDLLNVLSLAFKDGQAVTWNPDDLTINIPTGIGPVIQAGQEMVQRFQNATGATITNGQMVYIIPGVMTNGYPHIALALADNHTTLITDQFMTTMDIPNGSAGFCTKQGKVRGLDTSAYSTGAVLWLSTTVPGGYTNVPPEFPNYRISVGIVIASHATEGIISVVILNRFTDTLRNFHNGTFREKFVFAVTSDGVTITGTLSPKGTNADMTMLFSDGFSILDTTPHITITITPGTSDTVNKVYIYVLQSNKTVIEGSSWPEVEHIRIAEVAVLDAASTQADGPVLNQNFNDAVQGTTGQGHLSHITERLRKEGAVWDSGTEGLITLVDASTPDAVFLSVTGGVIFQLHKHTFLAMDQATGDKVHITNHPTTPYVGVTNLNTQLLDASGVSLNNTSFSFVTWGIINNDSDNDHVLINLPTSSYAYTAVSEAISDPNNYSVYAIPNEFIGVGFLIARFTFTYKNDAWTLEATEDLRGAKPNVSAGGGVGGSGVTTFLGLTDAPSAYAGQAGLYPQVNAGETALEFYDVTLDILSRAQAGKNILINADNIISQRGNFSIAVTLTASAKYYEDRNYSLRSVVTAELTHKSYDTTMLAKPIRIEATSAATGYMERSQPIEKYYAYADKTVTFTVLVKSNTVTNVVLFDGVTRTYSNTHTGGGGVELLTLTKAVSAGATQLLASTMTFINGSTTVHATGDYFEVGRQQLEIGDAFSDWEVVNEQQSLAQCQRYGFPLYEINHGTVLPGIRILANLLAGSVTPPVTLRGSPIYEVHTPSADFVLTMTVRGAGVNEAVLATAATYQLVTNGTIAIQLPTVDVLTTTDDYSVSFGKAGTGVGFLSSEL